MKELQMQVKVFARIVTFWESYGAASAAILGTSDALKVIW